MMENKDKTYRQALEEIENIIVKLESGDAEIDIITEEVKKASELINFCRQKLHSVEKELNDILQDGNE